MKTGNNRGPPRSHRVGRMSDWSSSRINLLPESTSSVVSSALSKMGIFDLYKKTSDQGGHYSMREADTYEELLQIEKERINISSKCEESSLKILSNFRGTILMEIFRDFFFWFTLLTYLVFRLLVAFNAIDVLKESSFNGAIFYITFFAGFLISFLLHYVGANNERYFDFLDDTWYGMSRIMDIATFSKMALPVERSHRIVRYINAAHIAAYTGLKNAYHKSNFFGPLVQKYALLDEKELKRVCEDMDVDSGGEATMEILTWVMRDIRSAKEANFLDSGEAEQMRDHVLRLRAILGRIMVKKTAPIPFIYLHFLCMLTAVYLPVFAIIISMEAGAATEAVGLCYNSEVVKAIIVILQSMFIIGLRIAGQQETEPYGSELIDIQLLSYVKTTLDGSFNILDAAEFEPPNFKHEMRIRDEKKNNSRRSQEIKLERCYQKQSQFDKNLNVDIGSPMHFDESISNISEISIDDIEVNRNVKWSQGKDSSNPSLLENCAGFTTSNKGNYRGNRWSRPGSKSMSSASVLLDQIDESSHSFDSDNTDNDGILYVKKDTSNVSSGGERIDEETGDAKIGNQNSTFSLSKPCVKTCGIASAPIPLQQIDNKSHSNGSDEIGDIVTNFVNSNTFNVSSGEGIDEENADFSSVFSLSKTCKNQLLASVPKDQVEDSNSKIKEKQQEQKEEQQLNFNTNNPGFAASVDGIRDNAGIIGSFVSISSLEKSSFDEEKNETNSDQNSCDEKTKTASIKQELHDL